MRVFGRGDIKNKARGNRKHHVNLDITYLACFGFRYLFYQSKVLFTLFPQVA